MTQSQGIRIERRHDPAGVDRVLRSLPTWFGIEKAIRSYVDQSAKLDSFLAVVDGLTIGVALVDRHFPESAELSLIAVHADHRAAGIGRSLVTAVADHLRADECRLLEVHTVGPSFPDAGYAATRAFYRAVGFLPMHEFDGLDWEGPTLILVRALTTG